MQMFPTIAYHKTLAPEGQLIQSAAQLEGLGDGWVDTPAAFDPNYVRPEPMAPRRAGAGPRRGSVLEFPAVRYNRVGEDRLVRTAAEADALDPEDWKASPADFGPVAAPPARPAAPAPPVTPAAAGEDAEERERKAAEQMAADARELHAVPVAEVLKRLEGAPADILRRVKDLEMLNQEGPRVTLVRAIDAALKAIAETPAP